MILTIHPILHHNPSILSLALLAACLQEPISPLNPIHWRLHLLAQTHSPLIPFISVSPDSSMSYVSLLVEAYLPTPPPTPWVPCLFVWTGSTSFPQALSRFASNASLSLPYTDLLETLYWGSHTHLTFPRSREMTKTRYKISIFLLVCICMYILICVSDHWI